MKRIFASRKRTALFGAKLFGGVTILAFTCNFIFGSEQQTNGMSFLDCLSIVGMPAFFLVGGAEIGQLGAALISTPINSICGAIILLAIRNLRPFVAEE